MRQGRTNAWMDGGYVELDDTWEGPEGTTVNDAEMKEGVTGGGKKDVVEKEHKEHKEKEHSGIRKWNSLRDHHHHNKGTKSTGGDLEGIQVRKSVDVTVQVEESIEEHGNGNGRSNKRESEYEKGTAL